MVIGLACNDGNEPPVPSAMALTSGNNQSALPGVALAAPLRVTLSGAGGAPFPGARVNWTVTSGSAALSAAQSTTDAAGQASVTVTIGVVPGNIVVTAAAAGVPSVQFQLVALDPCDVTSPFSADSVGTGTLTTFDCQFNGPYFTDFHSFSLPAQAGVQIGMTASFDTYLELYHVSGPFFAYNDDRDTLTTHSRINFIGAAGSYVFSTSTYVGNVTGTYGMSVTPRTQAITGCPRDFEQTWISRGVALTDQVEATDCATARGAAGTGYSDRILITLTPARALSATLASAAFNPRLMLYVWTSTGPVFVTQADGVAGTATLNYTPPQGGIYRLEVTSPDSVQTGAYTLNVAGPLPNAVGAAVERPGFAPEPRARPLKARAP
jgi:hypothetical protein